MDEDQKAKCKRLRPIIDTFLGDEMRFHIPDDDCLEGPPLGNLRETDEEFLRVDVTDRNNLLDEFQVPLHFIQQIDFDVDGTPCFVLDDYSGDTAGSLASWNGVEVSSE